MFKYKPKLNIKWYIVHNTAVSRAKNKAQLQSVDTYHKDKDWGGGWKQKTPSSLGWWVGYNFLTEPNGKTTQTRLIGEETIANINHNCSGKNDCDAISHCFTGYFKVEDMTEAQIEALKAGFNKARNIWPDIKICQHKDLQAGRTCAELDTEWLNSVILQKENPLNLVKENKPSNPNCLVNLNSGILPKENPSLTQETKDQTIARLSEENQRLAKELAEVSKKKPTKKNPTILNIIIDKVFNRG